MRVFKNTRFSHLDETDERSDRYLREYDHVGQLIRDGSTATS